MNKLFTIGYSNYSLESFVNTLKEYGINAIADVRSIPYSEFNSNFNRETLKIYLKSHTIDYVFLGKECGARIDDPTCYYNGKVDYNLVSNNVKFQNGLVRIKKGIENYTIALMCAEKDPINCHRMILVGKNLKKSGVEIFHILNINSIETQTESEKRLLELFKLDQPELFLSEFELIQYAYDKQAQIISFKSESESFIKK